MMLTFFFLVIFFILLGKSSDVVVRGVKKVSRILGIPEIFSGLVLGFFTSAPEFFIGIHSTLREVGEISVGNLLGGIIILFSLLTPLDILLNRGIKFGHSFKPRDFIFIALYLILPLLTLIDGTVSRLEGWWILYGYIVLVYLICSDEVKKDGRWRHFARGSGKALLAVFFGLAGVLVFSALIVDMATKISSSYRLPLFFLGFILFSFGTNLPELIVTLRAWRAKAGDIAIGTSIGSAVTNMLILGIIAAPRPIRVSADTSLFLLLFFCFLSSILFMFLALSGRRFSPREGVALLSVYILFIFSEIIFAFV